MRISVEKVRFRNFLLFGNNTQEIELKQGLNIIVGSFPGKTNSNKAGKSSFTDLISFALYGKVLKNLRQDQLVNWRNKRDCWVEIDFTKGKDSYTIKRGLKPNAIEVIKNGVSMPFVGKRDIQHEIEDSIFGINFNTFVNLAYTNINYSTSLLRMKSVQKRQFMENLFGLEMFAKLNSTCMSKLTAISHKIDKINNDIRVNSAIIAENNKHIEELSKDNNTELEKRLTEIDLELSGIEEISISEINDLLVSEHAQLRKLEIIHNAVGSKLEIYKVKEKHLRETSDGRSKIEGSYTSIKRKIKDLTGLIDSHDDIAIIDEKIVSCKEKRESLQDRINKVNNDLVSTDSLRDNKSKDLKLLRNESSCPLCRRAVDDYMIYTIIENEIKAYNEEYKRLIAGMKLLLSQIKDQDAKIGVLEREKKAIKDLKIEVESFKNQLSTIESVRNVSPERLGNKIIAYYRVNNIFTNLKKHYKGLIVECKKTITELTNTLSDYNKNNELLEERRKIKYHIDYNIKQQEDTNNKIIEIRGNIKQLTDKNESLNVETGKMYKLVDYLTYIKDICKDDKIKQYAISSVVPYLNKKTNEYLNSIGYNFYVELDKWIECTIKGPGIHDGSYASLSGGESRAVDIALMMAFHSIARLSAPNYFDVIVLDEIIDSSIDSTTINGVLEIIRTKQREDNLKMFIVTHRQEISNIEFDNVYKVERNQGYSKVNVL